MIFNGHTEQYIDTIDEELFAEIQVMYADGLLGNKGIFDAITPLTTAVFNYFRANNASPYNPADIFPWVVEYSVNPDHQPKQPEVASNGLLGFISQAKNFRLDRFNHGR
jgi:hypothetical protein